MHQYGIHPWNPDKALSNELTNKTSNAIPNPTYIFNSSCKKLTSDAELLKIAQFEAIKFKH